MSPSRCGGLNLPHLQELGLGNIIPVRGVAAAPAPLASWGRMAETVARQGHPRRPLGDDGHRPGAAVLPLPRGLSRPSLLAEFKRRTGVAGILGNKAASGTEIIAELGAEHVRTGFPIVYTSADSVFQIAAHEEVIPLPELYEMCLRARTLCDEWRIGRVIARPFIGSAGRFQPHGQPPRFFHAPPGETVLDVLQRERPGP